MYRYLIIKISQENAYFMYKSVCNYILKLYTHEVFTRSLLYKNNCHHLQFKAEAIRLTQCSSTTWSVIPQCDGSAPVAAQVLK